MGTATPSSCMQVQRARERRLLLAQDVPACNTHAITGRKGQEDKVLRFIIGDLDVRSSEKILSLQAHAVW